MAKTTSTVDQLRATAAKPLYAVAGATELTYELATGYAAVAQKSAQKRVDRVQSRVNRVERDPKGLQDQAVSLVNARVEELTKDAKEAQARFEARLAELQKDARAIPSRVQGEIDETVTELARTYADLVDRGEKLVAAIRKDGVKAVSTIRKAPTQSSVVRRERAKAAADQPQASSTTPVKKSATKKPTARKTPARATAKKTTAATKKASSAAKKATPTTSA
jgi:vacuolar-type H+-ATPase subunit I/STV1